MGYRTAEQILTARRDMLRDHIRDLELELAQARKDLQATIEQLIKVTGKSYSLCPNRDYICSCITYQFSAGFRYTIVGSAASYIQF